MKQLKVWMIVGFFAGMALLSPAVAQQLHEVQVIVEEVEGRLVPEFYFEPTGLYIQPGDTVRFIPVTPNHTATAYHTLHGKQQRVPEGVEPFSSPVIALNSNWEYTFDTPGVYDLYCAPHELYGMVMRVVVGEASGPATEAPSDFSPGGTFGAAGTVLSDPILDPQHIIDAGSVSWHEISAEAKVPPQPPGGEGN
ncbi:MAG: plastocyanin/azurin family copper-binding protein [Deinococcota bacterium]|jgi:plastocyanin|nr:plastocyanin/azurin family copper-binding protein [Deinococcota bacterium]